MKDLYCPLSMARQTKQGHIGTGTKCCEKGNCILWDSNNSNCAIATALNLYIKSKEMI